MTLHEGRVVVVKLLDPGRDLIVRATGGDGRLACLWVARVLGRLPPVVGPDVRARERADLDWWVAGVRRELEAWGPI